MSPKKRSAKNKSRRSPQVSGNPQRRAEQLLESPAAPSDLLPELSALQSLIGGEPAPSPEWADSYERVLRRAGDLASEIDVWGLEHATSRLVGDVLGERVEQQDGGVHPKSWLRGLISAAEQEVRTSLDGTGWRPAWLLLQGICAWAPRSGAHGGLYQAVLSTNKKLAKVLAQRGLLTGNRNRLAEPVRPRVAGEPLVLHDVYGSRAALLAPFSLAEDGADPGARQHPQWYCWDVDECGTGDVVGAGVFDGPEEALEEWRAAVGEAVVTGADPSPCPPGEVARLLSQKLADGPFADMRQGGEPRALMVEWFRLERRARDLAAHVNAQPTPDAGPARPDLMEDFRAWYSARNGEEAEFEDVATLADSWGPHDCTAPLIYACSPHRIAHATVLITDGYLPEYVPGIMRLLPEWVEWCIERSQLAGAPADRARAEAREAVSGELLSGGWSEWEETKLLFRRAE